MDYLKQFGAKLAQWRDDPVLFVEEALGVETMAGWQREALQALADGETRLAIKSGHGVGKTAFIAWVDLWWQVTHIPHKVAITANRQDQLADVVWPEIRMWAKKLPPALQALLEITSEKVFWKADPDNFAVARTARKESPEAFQGFHSKHMLFVADEASGIDDVIFEVGQGAMSTPGAVTILTGNPTRTSGYFKEAFSGRGKWWTRTVSSLEVIAEGLPYSNPAYPQEVADEYGIDSNVYRYRVLGEFAVEDDDAVISRLLAEAAVNRNVQFTGRVVWGLDPARFGDDRTALVKRKGNAVTEVPKWWKGLDSTQVAGKILEEWDNTPEKERPDCIMVDAIGYGAGVADRMKEAGLPVKDVNVGETASSNDQFPRLRDELWWMGRKFFEALDSYLPEGCDDLINELTEVKYEFLPSRKIKVESKDEIKKRLGRGKWGGRSPDLADAFILTFASYGIRPSAWKKPIEWAKYQTAGMWV